MPKTLAEHNEVADGILIDVIRLVVDIIIYHDLIELKITIFGITFEHDYWLFSYRNWVWTDDTVRSHLSVIR